MGKLRNAWQFVRRRSNKYVITVLLLVALIGFVGDSSIYRRVLNMYRLMELDRQIREYSIRCQSRHKIWCSEETAIGAEACNSSRIQRLHSQGYTVTV